MAKIKFWDIFVPELYLKISNKEENNNELSS